MAPRSSGSPREKRVAHARHRQPSNTGVSRHQFERLVAEAVATIPEPLRSRLENVAVVVEEEPTRATLARLGMSENDRLLGLYDGIPLTDRGDWYNLVPPDRIVIFRRPIIEICRGPDEIREQVARTVLHEIAHFYGIDDKTLESMGLS